MDLESLAWHIRAAAHVVWVSGAGLSVASGISPYRMSNDALWSRFSTEWATRRKLQEDPGAWYREFWCPGHGAALSGKLPNPGHEALARIFAARPHDVMITQNIDGLLARAGLDEGRLLEVHGRFGVYRCTDPFCERFERTFGPDEIDLRSAEAGHLPACDVCGDLIRPLVLLFDENYLSHPFFQGRRAFTELERADVLCFVGTSFAVGVTAAALEAGRNRGAILVNVNTDTIDIEGVHEVNGPAEQLLPALAALLA